jgi:formylglycine-generating enzyme required for sulfatase activity
MTGDCRLAPVRGGSWADAEENLRVTARQPQLRNGRANRIGFRIAKTIN